jgi:hypothetical protein
MEIEEEKPKHLDISSGFEKKPGEVVQGSVVIKIRHMLRF